ncbi:MAG: hypothetical protein ABEH81_01540 [Halopenitus sp.]
MGLLLSGCSGAPEQPETDRRTETPTEVETEVDTETETPTPEPTPSLKDAIENFKEVDVEVANAEFVSKIFEVVYIPASPEQEVLREEIQTLAEAYARELVQYGYGGEGMQAYVLKDGGLVGEWYVKESWAEVYNDDPDQYRDVYLEKILETLVVY